MIGKNSELQELQSLLESLSTPEFSWKISRTWEPEYFRLYSQIRPQMSASIQKHPPSVHPKKKQPKGSFVDRWMLLRKDQPLAWLDMQTFPGKFEKAMLFVGIDQTVVSEAHLELWGQAVEFFVTAVFIASPVSIIEIYSHLESCQRSLAQMANATAKVYSFHPLGWLTPAAPIGGFHPLYLFVGAEWMNQDKGQQWTKQLHYLELRRDRISRIKARQSQSQLESSKKRMKRRSKGVWGRIFSLLSPRS